jgi:glyoxylase-like metal-dependent hydrolase (beta-lactamase superfamily II)
MHGVSALKRQFDIDGIDVVLISHFHDDHVAGVPMLQRVSGTQVWVPENFADLLARPDAHAFPCDWPHPIRIDRRLALDRPFTWQEFTFRLAPMTGHTRFSSAISFEADGKRFAHTGDQFFLTDREGRRIDGDWTGAQMMQNHVYRNGRELHSRQSLVVQSCKRLREEQLLAP